MEVTEPLKGRAGISTQVNLTPKPLCLTTAHTVPLQTALPRPPSPQGGLRA